MGHILDPHEQFSWESQKLMLIVCVKGKLDHYVTFYDSYNPHGRKLCDVHLPHRSYGALAVRRRHGNEGNGKDKSSNYTRIKIPILFNGAL